ncbi:hypothetical protein [Deinococcus alpinitundrae]|uniref:hypothetical protein n=1 Tax=Deinococcus alpinitundrae TaxID=468913 RepID=UPI00137AF200|nr:hypothetical protein [Deinococcus alpinitundrae]
MTTPRPTQHEADLTQDVKTPAETPISRPEAPTLDGAALLMQATREAIGDHHEMFRRIAES